MITKNSKKATVSQIIKRAKRRYSIPPSLLTQLEEHTEGFLLFFLIDGKLCVATDDENNDAKKLGLNIMSKEYLDTVIEDGREFQKAMVLESINDPDY